AEHRNCQGSFAINSQDVRLRRCNSFPPSVPAPVSNAMPRSTDRPESSLCRVEPVPGRYRPKPKPESTVCECPRRPDSGDSIHDKLPELPFFAQASTKGPLRVPAEADVLDVL